MKKLIQVLRDRRGESIVEILVSTVVFMLLLGALNGAVGFASNAQRKSDHAAFMGGSRVVLRHAVGVFFRSFVQNRWDAPPSV